MDYGETIRSQVAEFVTSVESEFPGVADWVEGVDSETSIGLDHLDEYDDPEGLFEQNPLEVHMGISTEGLSQEDLDVLDEEIRAFADRKGVSVEVTSSSDDFTTYTFYLHGQFLDVPN